MINAQHPDLILISGDLIDNSVVPLYTENMAEELANLKAPMGIYMVLGNHEYISGIDESIRYIKSTQIQLLRDSVVTLPNGIQLIGRDDRHNRKRHSLQELMVNIDKSKPIIYWIINLLIWKKRKLPASTCNSVGIHTTDKYGLLIG